MTTTEGTTAAAAPGLLEVRDLPVDPATLALADSGGVQLAATRESVPRLAVLAPPGSGIPPGFTGDATEHGGGTLAVGPAAANAAWLRGVLARSAPRPLGLATSAGFGDRLGLATPGHVRAMRAVGGEDSGIAPIFAQQSVRENGRTGRTPRQVLDDATLGAFTAGWRGVVGADADHLKTEADVAEFAAAGFTFFTVDPGEHVAAGTDDDLAAVAARRLAELPWDEMSDTAADLRRRYPARLVVDGHQVDLGERAIAVAAVKYGPAVAHAVRLYRRLGAVATGPFEVELAVDETATPTTAAQHVYLVSELTRLGVPLVSLAPRFVGDFEKGVGYRGDEAAFATELAVHAAIARQLGPYKLSLHSGSDKFELYEPAMRITAGLVHLKTAGTSYLEALRTVAAADPPLFRDIYAAALAHFTADRAGYKVSARAERAAPPAVPSDAELPGLLDRPDERQILHVTFGSVIRDPRWAARLPELLRAHDEAHAANLERHLARHLAPFARPVARGAA